MSGLLLDLSATTQPKTANAQLAEWAKKDCLFAFDGGRGLVLAGSTAQAIPTVRAITALGPATSFNTAGADWLIVDGGVGAFPNGLTVLSVASRRASSGVQAVVGRYGSGTAGGFETELYNQYGAPANRVYSSMWRTSQQAWDAGFSALGGPSSANGDVPTSVGSVHSVALAADSLPSCGAYGITVGYLAGGVTWTGYVDVLLVVIWTRRLPNEVLRLLAFNPWAVFADAPAAFLVPPPMAPAGGVWNVNQVEAITGADTAAPGGTFGAPATDTLTVADTLATLVSQLAARLDTLAASDALSAGLSGSAAVADAASLADVFSSVSSVAGQTGEVASLAEAITGQILAAAAALSSVTLGDTLATALAAAVAALETSTPTDSPVADPLNAASSVEAFLGADAVQAALLGGAQAAEVVSVAELVATAMVALAYALDTAAPTDAPSSALTGLAALTEGVTPADASVTATASTYTVSLQEAVAALDALAASLNDVFRTYPLAGEAQTFALGAAIQTWVLENLQQPYPLNPSE